MPVTYRITSIETQKNRKDRVSVYLDDEYAFGIHQDVLIKAGIAKGDEITEDRIRKVQALEERRAAKEKAIRLLAVRARSKKEISDRLRRIKFDREIVDWVIRELERMQLLDDKQFALMYARTKMVTKPVASFLLRLELKQKGVPEEIIGQAIDMVFREINERDVARNLAKKRKKALSALEESKAKKRIADFLIRRGFQWDIVEDIIDNWEELDA